jgi:hypothetical protein
LRNGLNDKEKITIILMAGRRKRATTFWRAKTKNSNSKGNVKKSSNSSPR